MILIRFIALAAVIAIGVSVLMYVVTGEAKWRRLAARLLSVGAFAVGVFLLLLLLEHLLSAS